MKKITCLLIIAAVFSLIAISAKAQSDEFALHELVIKNKMVEDVGFKIDKLCPYDDIYEILYRDEEFEIDCFDDIRLPLNGGTYLIKFRIGYFWSFDCQYFKSETFELDEITPYTLFTTEITITLDENLSTPSSFSWYSITKPEYDR